MYPHNNTPDIPGPRQAPDDHIDNLPAIGSDQPAWRYEQTRPRGTNRSFSGHITHIGGTEGQRLRSELTDAIADLLHWARSQQHDETCNNNRSGGEGTL